MTKLAGIRQAIEMIQGDERLDKKVKIEEIYKEFTEMLDIDTDRWFMNDEDLESQRESEQAQNEMNQKLQDLQVQKLESEIQLENAKKETMVAETKMKAEELRLKIMEGAKNMQQEK